MASFRVKTSGNVITAQAFSDAAGTTQIGTDNVYTASSSTQTTKYGIIVTPASYGQGTTLSNVTITKN